MRPDLALLLGILAVCIFAALVSGCAHPQHDALGGLGFDAIAAAARFAMGL